MSRINNVVIGTKVRGTKIKEKLEKRLLGKKAGFSTVEAILLIIVVIGLVYIFKESAGTFITNMWTRITEIANNLFPTTATP